MRNELTPGFCFYSIVFVSLIFVGAYVLFTHDSYISPFLHPEATADLFSGGISEGRSSLVFEYDADRKLFHPYRDVAENGASGFQYKNKTYGEEVIYSDAIALNINLVDPFSDGTIIDYWIQGFKASPKKKVFSVCYQFRSGAVLQAADLYDIYGKPEKTLKPHKYRVVRMFFVGDRYKARKYRKYFGKAYFETEANIQHYKQLMKEGKGWVRQANRYIKEKEVKEEKPILDYRTNPDYYKALSARKTE